MAKAPKPFKYRGAWRAQVTLKNGSRPAEDFTSFDDAKQWIIDTLADGDTVHAAVLGGPKCATLAQALDHYARYFSIGKGGVVAELNRINRYLSGAGMPLLKAVTNAMGATEIQEYLTAEIPTAWKAFNDKRRALRVGTYTLFASLANKRCSTISPSNIRELFVQMTKDGLSDSTVQKEIAMLKTMFNKAVEEWEWKGFENPCLSIRLGKSDRRFVHLTQQQREDLNVALGECDNPYFWPLVIVAKETTLRRETVLKMEWSLIDLENRTMMLPTKTGQKQYSISTPVLEVLTSLPRDASGFVFPMTPNAVTLAWNRVRERASLPGLQYRDLRHLGATDWVRRGLGTHELRHVLGHTTIATAQFYVDLVGEDQRKALDLATAKGGVVQLPPSSTQDAQTQRNEKRALRLNAPKVKPAEQTAPSHESEPPVAASASPLPVSVVLVPQVSASEVRAPGPTGMDATESLAVDATSIFLREHAQSNTAMAKVAQEMGSNVVQFRPRKVA